jgi:hypothetical protein
MMSIFAIVWTAIGAIDYLLTEIGYERYLSMFTPEVRDYFAAYPVWAVAAWAIGVWAGLIGALLLAARNRHAVLAFALSALGLLINTLYIYALTKAPAEIRTFSAAATYGVVLLVAFGLLAYARGLRARGVLR